VTVYVDDVRIPDRVGRVSGTWSHLFTGPWDDPAELHGEKILPVCFPFPVRRPRSSGPWSTPG
jgi:hypothetical protein